MKLKKVLSLILAIGSLSTISSFFNSKAVNNFEGQVGSDDIAEIEFDVVRNNIQGQDNTNRLY